jgi:hypothetical protein
MLKAEPLTSLCHPIVPAPWPPSVAPSWGRGPVPAVDGHQGRLSARLHSRSRRDLSQASRRGEAALPGIATVAGPLPSATPRTAAAWLEPSSSS